MAMGMSMLASGTGVAAPGSDIDWEDLPETFRLASAPTTKVAALLQDQSADGSALLLLDATDALAQTWTLSALADGSVAIRNVAHAKVLDVQDASGSSAARVQIATYRGGVNQRWTFKNMGNNHVNIIHRSSGKCLDVLGDRSDSGAPIGLWQCNDKANQLWSMSLVGPAERLPAPTRVPGRTVGMHYAVWHWPAWSYMHESVQSGLPALSVETVLRSRQEDGSATGVGYTFAQMHAGRIAADEGDFYYQYDPQPGFYCIYHRRSAGAVNYNPAHEGTYGHGAKPDCPTYKSILKQHAQQLNLLGVDFVFVDLTHHFGDDIITDATQTRPLEVLLEQWQGLRSQGQPTPGVVPWQRLPPMPARPSDGQTYAVQRVLNLYNDAAYAGAIMRDAASGKKIFLYRGNENTDAVWPAFIASNGGRNDVVAVPMGETSNSQWCAGCACSAGAYLSDDACNQPTASHGQLGAQSSVTPMYRSSSWASLPFQSVGVHHGLTLRKQFWSALAQQPNWLLIRGWNEQIAQAWPSEATAPKSMGFETDPTIGHNAFVDLYGAEYTRDIEPTQQSGSAMYDIAQSCLRLYRAGATACSDPSERCCQGGNFSQNYRYYDGGHGLFELYAPGHPQPGTQMLYECMQGTHRFLSNDATCGGHPLTQTIGHVAGRRGGFTLRPLLRCATWAGALYYSLTGSCANGRVDAYLGYVR